MKIIWAQSALSHLEKIHDYIAQDSPYHAMRFIDRLLARVELAAQFPYSACRISHRGPEALRELIVGRYRILYEVQPDRGRIRVFAVIHTARDWNQD